MWHAHVILCRVNNKTLKHPEDGHNMHMLLYGCAAGLLALLVTALHRIVAYQEHKLSLRCWGRHAALAGVVPPFSSSANKLGIFFKTCSM